MIINLEKKLKELREQSDTPIKTKKKIKKANQKLKEKGTVDGLNIGDKAPDFTLPDQLNNKVNLYEVLEDNKVILTFYRGSWWPYCSLQLQAYQEALPEVHDLGAELIAISPQTPDHSLSQQEKENLSFKLLSDTKGEIAEKYNILFEVPPVIKEIYKGFGLDLNEYNEAEKWILPVPGLFIINKDGIIKFAEADVDYTKRVGPKRIIDKLKNYK